jgi:signal transduction histidine kinase
LAVRHRNGSLEAVVERSRIRNIIVVSILLLVLAGAIAALVRYTRRAQKLADLQMEFVASVSHELRTPLSVMRTAGHNLQGRVASDPARVRTYGALVEEQSGKLASIVDQVLSFANANAGRVIGAREPLEVSGIIQEALEGPLAEVEKHVSPDLPLVAGDRTTLRHAIRNLVDNALKYGRENVSIAAADRGDAVEIRVADAGPGIPPEELPHLFDPFYRGRKAIEDQIHGTGLGLCLTKRIVEAHDGSIRVQSAVGKGTQFIVRLPAMRPESA